ncbi:MAG: rhomboid family intramembrane serine protease [Bacteroidota bacterium]
MMLNITDVVKHLLIINVLMFLVSNIMGLDSLALAYFESQHFQPYQFATYFFMHGDITHLLFNMIGLVFFGSVLEQYWGPKKFLFFYFFCAIGSAVLHYSIYYIEFSGIEQAINAFAQDPSYDHFVGFFQDQFGGSERFNATGAKEYKTASDLLKAGDARGVEYAVNLMNSLLFFKVNAPLIVGASGAIFGVLLAVGLLFPEMKITPLFLPFGIKAMYFVPILMIIELQLGVRNFEWDNIAHYAHLGGAVSGAVLILYWQKFGSRFD